VQAVQAISRVRQELIDAYDGGEIPDRVMNVIERLNAEYREAKGTSYYLRSDIIWHKPNPMPESVTDRPTKSHEYLFLLTKQPVYYYDNVAIKEPAKESSIARLGRGISDEHKNIDGAPGQTPHGLHQPRERKPVLFGGNKAEGYGTRIHSGKEWNPTEGNDLANKRSVWTVATQNYKGAHFATFPKKLIEPCILAGSRVGDTVLDPFNGSGTTGAVAVEHGRNYVGIELNPAYIELAKARIEAAQAQGVLVNA
jgi:DNA modification methylase